MLYKNIILFCLLGLISSNQVLTAQSRDLPDQFSTPKTPFLSKLMVFKNLSTKIFLSATNTIIPTTGTIFSENVQEIIKSNDSVFVLLERTGVVYSLDPFTDSSNTYRFKRLDHTININYNIEANNFLYKNHLYSYGGYGFWRLNGQLRSYNFLDKEWDITPTNYEIISNGYNWVSQQEGKLFVPFQTITNGSIKGDQNTSRVREYDSYSLDLNLMEWKKLGTIHSKTINLVKSNNIVNSFLTTDRGFLFLHLDGTYYFDFLHNKIFKSKSAELDQFFIRRTSNENIFYYKDTIYSYIPSLQTFDTKPLPMSDFEELDFPIWSIDKNYYFLLLFLSISAIIIFFSIKIFNRSVNKKIKQSNLKILKTKTVGQVFVGVELSLIQLLLAAYNKGQHVEISQINHVLGIKDKNIGLQKKVRSDVINSVNEKYSIILNKEAQLISSIRKKDDKRFYAYFINELELNSIKKILGRK
jgi:hypothetical protein